MRKKLILPTRKSTVQAAVWEGAHQAVNHNGNLEEVYSHPNRLIVMIVLAQNMTAKEDLFGVKKILKYNFGNSGRFRNQSF